MREDAGPPGDAAIDAPGALPALAFGPFVLDRARKQLLQDGQPLKLGGRAFDLLTVLAQRWGEVVSSSELEAQVWPRRVVEETSVRVHISALRKALGDGKGQARYIANVVGRGYSLVTPVVAQEVVPAAAPTGPSPRSAAPIHNLPARIIHPIGRSAAIEAVARRLETCRLVSIVGPGGMGKTTVALAVAEHVLERYADGVWFVDFGTLTEPTRLLEVVATALSISVNPDDPWTSLLEALADARMLVVLDNCEHVIDATAMLAERLLRGAPDLRVLVTSREALDTDGEWVHLLPALEVPELADAHDLTKCRTSPAVQLFLERASANSDAFVPSDANVALACQLCRRLDGMPLAIELAAGRVNGLGLQGLAERIDEIFALLTRGRRTASPRHRTLRALLDWSHELLTQVERVVFRRLSVFRSAFTLEAAIAVLGGEELAAADITDGVAGLADKSLLSVDLGGERATYSLLFTTRTYAEEKLAGTTERRRIDRAHARHVQSSVIRILDSRGQRPIAEWVSQHGSLIHEVRAGLDWAFSPAGDRLLAVELMTAAIDFVLELGLQDQFRARVDAAIALVDTLQPPRPELELRLQSARGFMQAHTRGLDRARRADKARMLDLLEQIDSAPRRFEALFSLCANAFSAGDYREVGEAAERIRRHAVEPDAPVAVLLSDRFLAQSHHYLGRHELACRLARRVLAFQAGNAHREYIGVIPTGVSMRIVIARSLWMQGACDQAVEVSMQAVHCAAGAGPQALSQALAMGAIPVAMWRGEDERARALVERLREHATRHSQDYWKSWAANFQQALARRLPAAAVDRSGEWPRIDTLSGPAELDMLGTLTEAAVTHAVVERVEAGLVGWCAPEIIRASTENALRDKLLTSEVAEAAFMRALALARAQAALSWELRIAMSLARLWAAGDRGARGRDLLREVCARLGEGADTADQRRARALADPRR